MSTRIEKVDVLVKDINVTASCELYSDPIHGFTGVDENDMNEVRVAIGDQDITEIVTDDFLDEAWIEAWKAVKEIILSGGNIEIFEEGDE